MQEDNIATETIAENEAISMRLVLLLIAMFTMLASAAMADTLKLPDDYYTHPQANTAPLPPQGSEERAAPITTNAIGNSEPSVIVSPVPYNSNFGEPPLHPVVKPAPAAKPVVDTAVGETSISGGIGEDDPLRTQPGVAANHNLKLVFTGEGGAYLADVNYTIRNNSGTVVAQGTTYGPILLLTLPAGTYQLEAEAEGITKKQSIRAGTSGQQTYQLRYPIS